MERQFGGNAHIKKNFIPYLTKTFWKYHYILQNILIIPLKIWSPNFATYIMYNQENSFSIKKKCHLKTHKISIFNLTHGLF
jgi:hypothetical protein